MGYEYDLFHLANENDHPPNSGFKNKIKQKEEEKWVFQNLIAKNNSLYAFFKKVVNGSTAEERKIADLEYSQVMEWERHYSNVRAAMVTLLLTIGTGALVSYYSQKGTVGIALRNIGFISIFASIFVNGVFHYRTLKAHIYAKILWICFKDHEKPIPDGFKSKFWKKKDDPNKGSDILNMWLTKPSFFFKRPRKYKWEIFWGILGDMPNWALVGYLGALTIFVLKPIPIMLDKFNQVEIGITTGEEIKEAFGSTPKIFPAPCFGKCEGENEFTLFTYDDLKIDDKKFTANFTLSKERKLVGKELLLDLSQLK